MTTEPTTRPPITGWVGWLLFGGIMLITLGLFQVFQALIALIDDEFRVAVDGGILVFDVTAWGWVHLIIGVLLVIAGVGVLRGALWGRILGVTIAALNLIAQLTILPVYPIWALIIVTLDAFVIYALVVHGQEAARI